MQSAVLVLSEISDLYCCLPVIFLLRVKEYRRLVFWCGLCKLKLFGEMSETNNPDWKTWQLSTRYRARQRFFDLTRVRKFSSMNFTGDAFHLNHNGVWYLRSQKLLWLTQSLYGDILAAQVPRVLSQREKRNRKGPTFVPRGLTFKFDKNSTNL